MATSIEGADRLALARRLGVEKSPGVYQFAGVTYFDLRRICQAAGVDPDEPANVAYLAKRLRERVAPWLLVFETHAEDRFGGRHG